MHYIGQLVSGTGLHLDELLKAVGDIGKKVSLSGSVGGSRMGSLGSRIILYKVFAL